MRDLPVVMDGYRLTVVEPPCAKTRTDERGNEVTATDRDGVQLFVVSLFAKLRPADGQRAPKGEEIKVTLATDPGLGFEEDVRVELIGPSVSPYEISNGGRTTSGLAWRAVGIKRAAPVASAAPRGGKGKDAAEPGSDGEQ